MPVDIVEDLPAHVNGDDSPGEVQAGGSGDTVGDRLDARWFSRGSGAAGALHGEVICNILSARVQKSIQQSFSLQYIQIYIHNIFTEQAVKPHTHFEVIPPQPG